MLVEAETRHPREGERTVIRVLLADDHAMVRAGLSLLIRSQPDMQVAGEARNAAEALRLSGELQPNVTVLDISMPPGDSGLEVISALRETSPDGRILVLTMHDEYTYLRAALAAGAAGYVVKTGADEELITAIRTVDSGRTFFSVTLTPDEADSLETSWLHGKERSPVPELSWREAQVLEFVAYGYTSQQVADQLRLSIKTVDGYRSRLMEKLGLHHRADLVRYAIQKGIVEDDRLYPRDFRFEDSAPPAGR